jgi:hypothetical protein
MTKEFYDKKDVCIEDTLRFMNLEIRARLNTYIGIRFKYKNIALISQATDFTSVASLIDFWLDAYELIPTESAYVQTHPKKT